ncbi:hypothetical protein SEA_MARGARET_53 [Gordonia phage Margaret]|nr:hypothetical protein SEA_MARGARET_53 [Gordonia phage Margaret]
MHKIWAPNMHTLHDTLARDIQYAHQDRLDLITPMDSIFEHVYAVADSMEYTYDFKRVWVPPSRWTMMIRQYLDPDEVNAWLALIEKRLVMKKKAGRPVFRTKIVHARTGGKGTVRNLGSCMLTLSFTLDPRPTLTMHSRACYVGYLSPLDMAVAYHMGRLAADVVGIPLSDVRFCWFIETAQMHKFRTIAFVLGDPDEEAEFKQRIRDIGSKERLRQYPALYRSWYHWDLWKRWNAEGVLYEDMPKFVSYQRLRKRWVAERMGYEYAQQFETPTNRAFTPLPSLDVKDLTLNKIGLE